jgi:YidC/Oxa1 family membrane protein insertase
MNTALYVVEAKKGNLSSQTISFDYIDGDITVHKSFCFGGTYEVGIQTSVLRKGAYVAAFPTWPSGFGDAVSPASYSKQGIDYASARDLKRMSPDKKGKKLRNGDLISGPLDWAGALDQYFAAIFLPEKPHEATLVTLQNSMDVPKSLTNLQADYVGVEVIGVGVGNSYGPTSERLFVGPKDLNLLGTVHPNGAGGQPNNDANFQGMVDFGIFSFVARPMFASLNWIEHKLVHNWG